MARQVIEQGCTLAAAAAAANVSPRTAAKWVRRYRALGAAGLADRTCRPHRMYRPTPPEQAELVEQLRRQRWTGLRISQQTGLSRATVSRILRRRKLSRMRDLEPRQPVHRYEHERPGDLLPLARHFLALFGGREGRKPYLSPEATAKIAAHPWPGNARELENAMQRALILAPGNEILAEHLLLAADALPPPLRAPAAELSSRTAPEGGENAANMRDLERQHILDTLLKVNGSRKKAVEILGISERTLRYKLAQYRDEGFWEGD